MRKDTCSACAGQARRVRGNYAFKESGLKNVVLQGIELIRCDQCGNEDPVIPRMNDLMRGLAVAVIMKPYRLRGEDLRFLRKYMRMTGDQLARLIHVDRATLSKWENDEDPIGQQTDRLIRMLTISMDKPLRHNADQVIELFQKIQDSRRRPRIELDPSTMEHVYA